MYIVIYMKVFFFLLFACDVNSFLLAFPEQKNPQMFSFRVAFALGFNLLFSMLVFFYDHSVSEFSHVPRENEFHARRSAHGDLCERAQRRTFPV